MNFLKAAYTMIGCACVLLTHAQKNRSTFVDVSGTIGAAQGSVAGSYVHNWKLGAAKKWEAGLGARITSYFGTKRDFTTAPARLARSTTTPFVIGFAGRKTENWDTLTVQRPFTNSLNLTANFGYNYNRWYAGFNIDLVGVTLGRTTSAILTSNGTTTTEPSARPARFNVLLTGDNDYGSLNSEFFLRYRLSQRWSVKGIYQFLFVEYKTTNITQTAPDGTAVDRFRNKANNGGLGITYHFNQHP